MKNIHERLIEENLLEFYIAIANQTDDILSHRGSAYSFVRTENFSWPNYVIGVDAEDRNAGESIMEIIEKIESGEAPPFIIVKNTTKNSELESICKAEGFRPVVHWTGMALQIKELPVSSGQDNICEISVIQSNESLKQWAHVVNNALFSQPRMDHRILMNLTRNDYFKIILCQMDLEPAGTAMTFDYGDSTGIYLVSVLPKFRRRGIGAAITKYIIENSNNKTMVLHASAAGKKVYDKFGFKEYCTFDVYWKMGKFV